MFNFFNEINDLLQVPLTSATSNYKYVNLSGRALYVQGYSDVLSFNEEQIVLKLKSGELNIVGKHLNIKELNPHSIIIEGIVARVEQMGGQS